MAAGREFRSLGLVWMGVPIVSVIRGEGETVPNGSTRLDISDRLLVAASGGAIQQFRELVAVPNAPSVLDVTMADGSRDPTHAGATSPPDAETPQHPAEPQRPG